MRTAEANSYHNCNTKQMWRLTLVTVRKFVTLLRNNTKRANE